MCVCVNWLKSASGFSFALTWHLPPHCHHKPDQKFSILRKTWEIDLGQDVGAVGNVNKGKLQRNPRVCVCFVLAILCAVYGRQRVCVCGRGSGVCVCVRCVGLTFCPLSTLSKLSTWQFAMKHAAIFSLSHSLLFFPHSLNIRSYVCVCVMKMPSSAFHSPHLLLFFSSSHTHTHAQTANTVSCCLSQPLSLVPFLCVSEEYFGVTAAA